MDLFLHGSGREKHFSLYYFALCHPSFIMRTCRILFSKTNSLPQKPDQLYLQLCPNLQGKTILLTPDVWEMPTYQSELAPMRILSKNLGSWLKKQSKTKNPVFWEGFYVYRHSVNLFIIYNGVKGMKLRVSWIKSTFYWHLLVVTEALCLTKFVLFSSHLHPSQVIWMYCPRKTE